MESRRQTNGQSDQTVSNNHRTQTNHDRPLYQKVKTSEKPALHHSAKHQL